LKTLSILILLFGLFFSGEAAAGRMRFGDHSTLHKIQDVEFTGPKGEKLYLAYKTTTKFFMLGVNLTEQGYVLAVKDSDEQGYYPLKDSQIKEFQNEGSLPNPLPNYKLTIFDYALGYSLWIVIFLLIIFPYIKHFFKRKEKNKSDSETTAR